PDYVINSAAPYAVIGAGELAYSPERLEGSVQGVAEALGLVFRRARGGGGAGGGGAAGARLRGARGRGGADGRDRRPDRRGADCLRGPPAGHGPRDRGGPPPPIPRTLANRAST